MWPGSPQAMGPPPPGPGPAWPPHRPIRPGAGWYAVPVVLVVAALLAFAVMLAFLWDDSEVADGPSATGDPAAGVEVTLEAGYGYFLFVRSAGSAPYKCALDTGRRTRSITLTRKNSWSATEPPGYRYTASFQAPVSGTARLTCHGADGPVLVTPDDTAHGYLRFGLMAVLVTGGVALLVFVVVFVRRRRAKRRAVLTGQGP